MPELLLMSELLLHGVVVRAAVDPGPRVVAPERVAARAWGERRERH